MREEKCFSSNDIEQIRDKIAALVNRLKHIEGATDFEDSSIEQIIDELNEIKESCQKLI